LERQELDEKKNWTRKRNFYKMIFERNYRLLRKINCKFDDFFSRKWGMDKQRNPQVGHE